MTAVSIARPARRFLHICYCCDDAVAVSDFFVEGLSMKNTMTTTDEYTSGEILGIEGDVRAVASFVYDRRGPRTSPAIEIQGWSDPSPVGEPSTDPFEIGIKAIGFAVPSVKASIERLSGFGCTVVDHGTSPFDERAAALIDPRRVTLELAEDATLDDDATQLHHLRITVRDLEESLRFYDMLGFDLIERDTITDGGFVGAHGDVDGEYARMRLPDEPFETRLVQWNAPAGHGHHYTEPNHVGIFRAAVSVDDTRASYEYLAKMGAVFDRSPMEVEMNGTPVPGLVITFISDPNGIPYEFVQRPRSAFR